MDYPKIVYFLCSPNKLRRLCLLFCGVLIVYMLSKSTVYLSKESFQCQPSISPEIVFPEKYNSNCTMDTCFDIARCSQFKVYVYPDDASDSPISNNYRKILKAIRRSPFYTDNPAEACLFVPSLDTLDRDPASSRFVRNIDAQLAKLPFWHYQPTPVNSKTELRSRPGMNHLLFVLFPGSWPYYDVDELRMNVGSALLARASASKVRMRRGFDVSFPLVTTDYPEAGQTSLRFPSSDNARIKLDLLTSFKGKRYVIGIGSETRNALYHIHNGKDIIMATTCKHMNNWNLYADSRCASDNAYYDTVSYEDLLLNSTFCLVPRGRRLGSFRFVEVLEAGCIPVILANDWELPFSEVIDWQAAVVQADERALSSLPALLRSIPDARVVRMREQVRFLWSAYFRTVDVIVHATLMSIRDRMTLRQKNYDIWNRRPGGIIFSETTSISCCDYPSSSLPHECLDDVHRGFTLLLIIRPPFCVNYTQRLKKAASVFVQSTNFKHVVVVWQCSGAPPPSSATLAAGVFEGRVSVDLSFPPAPSPSAEGSGNATPSPSNRFMPSHEDIRTLAVWSLELDCADRITLQMVEAAYALWLQHPHRLVGFTARSHVWDDAAKVWNYTINDNSTKNFSMVLLNAAVYHRYYHTLYWRLSTPKTLKTIDTLATGEDIFFNCVVGYASQSAPLLLTTDEPQAHSSEASDLANYMLQDVSAATVQIYRHTALRAFAEAFAFARSTVLAKSTSWPNFGISSATDASFLPLYYSNHRFSTS